jgi:hypothetical protein
MLAGETFSVRFEGLACANLPCANMRYNNQAIDTAIFGLRDTVPKESFAKCEVMKPMGALLSGWFSPFLICSFLLAGILVRVLALAGGPVSVRLAGKSKCARRVWH